MPLFQTKVLAGEFGDHLAQTLHFGEEFLFGGSEFLAAARLAVQGFECAALGGPFPLVKERGTDLMVIADLADGLRCERADEKLGRVIMDDIWEGIRKAHIIIANLTSKNPNVTYEVGLADVLGKDVILLSQNPKDVPFDFLGLRLLTYENSIGGEKLLSQQLEERIRRFVTAHAF